MWSRRASATLSAALALALASASARGAVLSEDELEGESTELGVIARSFSFLLLGNSLEPPVAPDDYNPTGVGILGLRLYFSRTTPTFKLVLHDELSASVSSNPPVLGLAFGQGLPPSRWLPLRFDRDDSNLTLASTVDWAYAAATFGRVTLTAGRQPVTFGRARIWRPIDLVSTFALTEVDTEYKPGADALRIDWSPNERSTLTVVAAAGELAREDGDFEADLSGSVGLARYKQSWDRGELGGIAGFVRGDAVAGADGVFDTGSVELYGEGSLTLVSQKSVPSPEASDGDLVPKAVIGAGARPTSTLTTNAELLYNGFGATSPAGYAAVAASERVAVGEQITLGRFYAAGLADWEIHPLLHLGGAALINLLDPSALLSLALHYEVAANAEVRLGGYVPFGRTPEAATALDDEFGAYPYFLFFEIKAVF